MTKSELRQIFKSRRSQLSSQEMLKMNDLILIRFQQIAFDADISTMLSYSPVKGLKEVDTHTLTDFLAFRIPGLTVAYPVADFATHTMKAIVVSEDSAFEENKYGIAEPIDGTLIDPGEIDLVFVPMLAFDQKGYRVGYGKGFYDRFLADCREDCIRIGFSFFDPVPAISDINQFDVPLNYGVTPDVVYEF